MVSTRHHSSDPINPLAQQKRGVCSPEPASPVSSKLSAVASNAAALLVSPKPPSPAGSNTLQHIPPQRQREEGCRNADTDQQRNERRIEAVLDRHNGGPDHRSHRRLK